MIRNPNDVIHIGEYAFKDCTYLSGITIPNTVTNIGSFAFLGCSSLESITLSNGVTNIEGSVFEGCIGLTSINLPSGITDIGGMVFDRCPNLLNINIIEDNSEYSSVDGVLYNKDKTTLISCPVNKTSVTILDSVEIIESNAFKNCRNLTDITIPNSVTKIEKYAFENCSNLISITIPDSVTKIGGDWSEIYSTFMGCDSLLNINIIEGNPEYSSVDGVVYNKDKSNLIYCPNGKTSVNILDSVDSIREYAFAWCEGLTSINIPDSIDNIGEGVFEGCESLTSITIPDNVRSIDSYAFAWCSNLTSIIIPNDIERIDSTAFKDCENLADVYYSGSQEEWNNISIELDDNDALFSANIHFNCSYIYAVEDGNIHFNSATGTIINYNTDAISADIPSEINGVEVIRIGKGAFESCNSLTTINIPDSIISIKKNIFDGCDRLTDINVFEDNHEYSSIDGTLYNKGKTKLIYCPVAKMSVTIPNNIKSIGEGAFANCSNLTDVYYNGSQEEWNNISIASNNDELLSVTIHFSSSDIEQKEITIKSNSDVYTINEPNGTLQMEYSINSDKYKGSSVKWSVINKTGKAIIDENGLLKALSDGEIIVRVSLAVDDSIYDEVVITIFSQSINIQKGDINANGILELGDAEAILEKVLDDSKELTVEIMDTEFDLLYYADMDNDGFITATDAAIIINNVKNIKPILYND